MNVRLRGHHLLCMLGYRGMGYSAEYAANMTRVYETLRQKPATAVQIVAGPDDLCAAFPRQLDCHCEDANVRERDQTVLTRLRLRTGDELSWQDVLLRIRTDVAPTDISVWCASCPWQPYGLCALGVAIVRAGDALPAVTSGHVKRT